jgi:hypothetical protein
MRKPWDTEGEKVSIPHMVSLTTLCPRWAPARRERVYPIKSITGRRCVLDAYGGRAGDRWVGKGHGISAISGRGRCAGESRRLARR